MIWVKEEIMDIKEILIKEMGLGPNQVENTIKLIDEGNTIPFIARYRKEMTGEMTDVQLREFGDRLTYLRNLEERMEIISTHFTIKPPCILYLNMVVILIESHWCITLIITMHYSIHQELTSCPIRIFGYCLFPQYTDRNRTLLCYACLYKDIYSWEYLAEIS